MAIGTYKPHRHYTRQFIYDGSPIVLPVVPKSLDMVLANNTPLTDPVNEYTLTGKTITFGDMVFNDDVITVKFST